MSKESKLGHAVSKLPVRRYHRDQFVTAQDQLTVEEPMELLIEFGPANDRKRQRISVNLYTPGQEQEWALGFLFAEGLIGSAQQVIGFDQGENSILVKLTTDSESWMHLQTDRLARQLAATASCGFCGKENLDGLSWEPAWFPETGQPKIPATQIIEMNHHLEEAQEIFAMTGGLHAAALFSESGELLLIREDIGRHNALDKLIGAALKQGLIPLRKHVLWLSGRVGFELVQKASMAGIPILVAVGAPSSMAVKSAEICGMTMVGFLRNDTFNCYCGADRISGH